MLIAPQVFEVTELLSFFYGVTWSVSRKNLFNWKDEGGRLRDEEMPERSSSFIPHPSSFETCVKSFFDRARFLRVVRDYIIFLTKDDELTKVILRPHQTRAVEKVIARVHDPARRRGLIWHTQGSGKTLTMITIASKLLRDEEKTEQSSSFIPHTERSSFEKPTVLMLVDRNELEAQLFKNITGYGISHFEVAQSKRDLQRLLASDYRGLIVSTIHKFDDIPANINTRASVVVLVDEAHRTTGGDLGNYLMAALPNATTIGFTGTPIDRLSRGEGTFKVFGRDDEQGYLDKYSIAESIEDGTTVALNYALAPSDLRVDRETLEREFLALAEAEGVSDVEELNAILDKAVELKQMMKALDRMDKIARHVARHFHENVEPMGFKAFLVAVDREACALYKDALDKYLPPEYSTVVYSPAHSDKAALKQFYLDEDAEKRVRKAFTQKDALPKILIVTEKLLTGFDAPILYCMYLDKPMRDHVLLQAIARVNRPYEDEDGWVKPFGFVLDFVGIFENLEKALAFDSDVVASVIQNVDVLKDLFASLMRNAAPEYLPFARGWDDKAKERALEYFADKPKREAFFKFFRQLQSLYDILSPDAALRPFMEDYQALVELFGFIRNAYSNRVYVDRELTDKTRRLLRERTVVYSVELPGAIHELGPKELAALKQSDASDTAKILNLRKILASVVIDEGAAKPFLLPIGERAEALAQAYEDRQITTQQALAEFEKLAHEVAEADTRRQHIGVDDNTYAIYTALNSLAPDLTAEQAQTLNALFDRFPDYRWNERQQSQLRTELYKALRPLVGAKMIEAANLLLRLQRI